MDGYLGPRKRCKCRKFNTKRLYNSIRQGKCEEDGEAVCDEVAMYVKITEARPDGPFTLEGPFKKEFAVLQKR